MPWPTPSFQCRSTSTIPCTFFGTKWLADSRMQRHHSRCSGTSSLWHHCGTTHTPYKDALHSFVSSGLSWKNPRAMKMVLCYWGSQQVSSPKRIHNGDHCFLRKGEWSNHQLACCQTSTKSSTSCTLTTQLLWQVQHWIQQVQIWTQPTLKNIDIFYTQ